MRTNYVLKHSRDHAYSEHVSRVEVDCKRAELTGNKQIHSPTNKQTNKHSTLYISTDTDSKSGLPANKIIVRGK